MTKPSDKTPQGADQPATKKPYRTPRLEVYGDLRKITNNIFGHGAQDNRFLPFLKTAR